MLYLSFAGAHHAPLQYTIIIIIHREKMISAVACIPRRCMFRSRAVKPAFMRTNHCRTTRSETRAKEGRRKPPADSILSPSWSRMLQRHWTAPVAYIVQAETPTHNLFETTDKFLLQHIWLAKCSRAHWMLSLKWNMAASAVDAILI